MPRGVYDRSKMKGAKAAAPAAKPAPEPKRAKAPAVAAKTRVSAKTEKGTDIAQGIPLPAPASGAVEAMYGFNILGANVAALSAAYADVAESNTALGNILATELTETIRTITALRLNVFGGLIGDQEVTSGSEGSESISEEAAAPAPPVHAIPSLPQPTSSAPPVLPQGNAAPFQPPAPPMIPNH